jgi:hypothetical protein
LTTPNSFVTFAPGSTSGAGGLVTINTTGPTASVRREQLEKGSAFKRWAGAGGAALAGLLLLGIPARGRRWKSLLAVLICAGAFAIFYGCGGGGGGGGSTGTTTGTYTFTVTGGDGGGESGSATLTVTVN